jgi:hypothetical protein
LSGNDGRTGKETAIARVLGATAIFVLAGVSVASAHNAPPCNDSGHPGNSDYALHHIVAATPGHVPGTHGGYSVCLEAARLVDQPTD